MDWRSKKAIQRAPGGQRFFFFFFQPPLSHCFRSLNPSSPPPPALQHPLSLPSSSKIFMGTFVVSFIGNGIVRSAQSTRLFSRLVKGTRLRRRVLVAGYFSLIVAACALFGVMTIPDIVREGADFVQRLKSDSIWVVVVSFEFFSPTKNSRPKNSRRKTLSTKRKKNSLKQQQPPENKSPFSEKTNSSRKCAPASATA